MAYGKVATAACAHALAGTDETDQALADSRAGRSPQSATSRPLCILRHCRKLSGTAESASSCGALLAQDAEQPELERRDLVDELPSDQGAVSAVAAKAVTPLPGVTSYRYAVRLLTSVVRENRTQTFCGSGSGRLLPATRWRRGDPPPYADSR